MSSVKRNKRGICQHDNCRAPREVFCTKHEKVLCELHQSYHHFECPCEQFITSQQLKNALIPLNNSLHQISQYGKAYDSVGYLIDNFEEALGSLKQEFEEIKQEISNKIERDQFLHFTKLKKRCEEFYAKFKRSDIYSAFKEFMFNKHLEDPTTKAVIDAESSNRAVEERKEFDLILRRVSQEVEQKVRQEVEATAARDVEELRKEVEEIKQQAEEHKNLSSTQATEIDALKTKIEKQKTEILQLNEAKEKAEEEFKNSVTELTQLQETFHKAPPLVCKDIWKRIYGKDMVFDKNTKIELRMNQQKDKDFVTELANLKIKLPNIKRLALAQDKKEDPVIKEFFKHCFPDQVELFCYNWDRALAAEQTKLNYYFIIVKGIIPRVTREVYLCDLDMTKQEFEYIVSNCKAPRLVIRYSKFDTSSAVTFTCAHSNIQYLSFQHSGRSERNDWPSTPSKCKHILQAISKSGLKDSLHTLEVAYCGLSVDEVKAFLPEVGLEVGKVIDNYHDPLSD
ncbi:unnamed protein product [Moneuplotes crassus]|uniref:Uncharacterized protein n=1 Tax=Euplotes crassus TaxID=5936 RepID=A0AAD1U0R0_EUPCR|nr:unnamed protein product [Moneuplotes crassus]